MINAAIIGTGYIGKVHLEALLKLPNVRVRALADKDIEQAEQLAECHQIEKCVSDYKELLDDTDIDVFHNCTPNNLHFAISKDILNAGKNIMSEKPLSITTKEAKELRNLSEEKGLITGINFCYRYYPVIQEASARIREGEIGKIHTLIGYFLQDWLLYDTDYNWRLDKKVTGSSNAVADIGSHWCDLAQFVSNSKIVEVMADVRTIIPVRKKSKYESLTFSKNDYDESQMEEVSVDVDDYGSVLVHFDNGASGVFTVCQLSAGRKVAIDMQIYGSQSSLAWNHEHPAQLWCGKRDAANELFIENPILQKESTRHFARLPAGHPMGYNDAVYNLFFDFYEALDSKRKGMMPNSTWPDFKDGYQEMKIVDAIIKSHREKKWMKIE